MIIRVFALLLSAIAAKAWTQLAAVKFAHGNSLGLGELDHTLLYRDFNQIDFVLGS